MGTYTEKLKLYKPDINEVGWETKVNENFDKIDAITTEQLGAEPKINKKTAFNKAFGTTEGTICQGNDPRLEEIKTLTPHTATTTKYGGASASLYGHAKPSSTVPKEAGTAYCGDELNTFARGDHVHPLQTSVPGNSGIAGKLIAGRAISFVGGVTSIPQTFDGTSDIDIPITKIQATSIIGSLPPSSLPPATTTVKGCVIVGDGLTVDEDGVLSVEKDTEPENAGKVYKVFSKGTTAQTDIRLGVLTYNLYEGSGQKRIEVEAGEHDVVLFENIKTNMQLQSFEKSTTLPTVFDYYKAVPTIKVGSIQVKCKVSVSTQSGMSCTFSFVRVSTHKVFATIDLTGVEVSEENAVEKEITFPNDWDIINDTYNVLVNPRYTTGTSIIDCIVNTTEDRTVTLYL